MKKKKKTIKTVTILRKDLEDTSWIKKPIDLQQNIPGADQEHFNHTKITFMQSSKVTEPEKILIEGAEEFIEIFEKPELALNAAVNALYIINHNTTGSVNDAKNPHFLFTEILENIISPWVAGNSTMIDDMASGIKQLYEFGNTNFFNESFISYLTYLIYFEQETPGYITSNDMVSLSGFRMLGDTIRHYANATEEIKRKAA